MVPGGELEHGAECDKGVNVSNTQGGRLAGDVQNRDQRGGENIRPKKNSQLVRTKDCGQWDGIGGKCLHRGGLFDQDGTSKRPIIIYSRTGVKSLVEAACVFRRLESAHKSCQAVATLERKKSANVVTASAASETISYEIQEHKELELSFTVHNKEK